jgi:hypothetical protein
MVSLATGLCFESMDVTFDAFFGRRNCFELFVELRLQFRRFGHWFALKDLAQLVATFREDSIDPSFLFISIRFFDCDL